MTQIVEVYVISKIFNVVINYIKVQDENVFRIIYQNNVIVFLIQYWKTICTTNKMCCFDRIQIIKFTVA